MKLYKNFIFTLLINLFIASTHAESGVDIMHGLHEARTGMFIDDVPSAIYAIEQAARDEAERIMVAPKVKSGKTPVL